MQSGIEVWPRVASAGVEALVTIRDRRDPRGLAPNGDYTVRFFSKVDRRDDAAVPVRSDAEAVLRVRLPFRARGEYTLDVRPAGEDNTENNKQPPLLSAQCFATALEPACLRPYKGDVHLHTTGSDGKNTTIEMLIGARRLGMDFAAVTDHDNHVPSTQAVREAASLAAGFLALRGEEVTILERGGHVVALDTGAGIGKMRGTEPATAACAELAATMAGRRLVSPLTPGAYAHAVWTVNEVRKAGGIAVMAHPYWEGSRGKFYPPRCIFEQLLADGLLDGVELIGGSPSTEGNLLCVAKYADEIAHGHRWAIVGGSDAHAAAELGRKFTLLFAETLSERNIVQSVLARRSVACDTAMGPAAVVFGPFDLVEYAYFLLREYYPEHDRLCAAQAALWDSPVQGAAPERRAAAEAIQRDLDAWRTTFWHAGEAPRAG